jgi:hypothetical protein
MKNADEKLPPICDFQCFFSCIYIKMYKMGLKRAILSFQPLPVLTPGKSYGKKWIGGGQNLRYILHMENTVVKK